MLALAAAAGEWRSGEPCIGAERAPIAQRPRESLAHQKRREFRTNGPYVHERADAFRLIGRRRLFQNRVGRRLSPSRNSSTTIFDTPQGWKLIGFGIAIVFVFAVPALSVSVVSFPMLLVRPIDVVKEAFDVGIEHPVVAPTIDVPIAIQTSVKLAL